LLTNDQRYVRLRATIILCVERKRQTNQRFRFAPSRRGVKHFGSSPLGSAAASAKLFIVGCTSMSKLFIIIMRK
jgi:hypothetical protein